MRAETDEESLRHYLAGDNLKVILSYQHHAPQLILDILKNA